MAASEGWTMPTGELMKGKKGLIMGVANANSIAWGIAKALADERVNILSASVQTSRDRVAMTLRPSAGLNAPDTTAAVTSPIE